MMPVTLSSTSVPLPTQISFVATALPGTQALRVLPDAVAPSMSPVALQNERQQAGSYMPGLGATPATTPSTSASGVLSIPIPAQLSTASASLSANAVVAAQFLSQGPETGGAFLAVYEALIAASEVKYKPSNATLPNAHTDNLFAKLLSDQQSQHVAMTKMVMTGPPAQEMPPQTATVSLAPRAEPPRTRANTGTIAGGPSMTRHASTVYHSTNLRNQEVLSEDASVPEDPPTEGV